ncbi:transmembrane protein 53 isoform X1 [Stegostoma tigrinum]|uniref:transmembrane protein 53 isoform X1 n=2 Tax=Stegostoma tigrinum TaxID=3053191 RepID=UPI002870749F|nr:transmembrane protein 53 isoform X1 [Stegostoma tigrinum]
MGDKDLEYTVVFPDPNDFGFKEDPVVILLGWGGCQDKHLSKYSYMYKNQGCIVLRYIAPWQQIFFTGIFSRNLHCTARKLLNLLFDIGIEGHPILFHVFSNAGSMLYRHIVELQCNKTEIYFTKLRVVGTIFDSAPGNRNLQGSIRALKTVLGSSTNVIIKCIAIPAFVLIVVLKVLLYPVTQFVSLSFYDALKVDPSRWPQLFLYSKADKIIYYKDVESMIKIRKMQNIQVQSMDFKTSQHVNHFREFPDEYSNKCINFLKECIRKTALFRLFDKKNVMQ